MTLTHLAEKEKDLPNDADTSAITALADEIQAYSLRAGDSEVITSLLIRLAQRLHGNTDSREEAITVLSLAQAGCNIRHLTAMREQAYQDTYSLVKDAIGRGMSQVDAAKISGLDRMTVRKAIGKPRKQKTSQPTQPAEKHQEAEFDLILAELPQEEPQYVDFPPHRD